MFESYKSQISEGEFPLSLPSKCFSMLFGIEYLNDYDLSAKNPNKNKE